VARTTRLNISVPSVLQERLRKVKDRINVSKVCVAALERELGTLEARPTVDAGQLERLIRRLQSNQERWSERGRRDGEHWAVETATRAELRWVGEAGGPGPTGPYDGAVPRPDREAGAGRLPAPDESRDPGDPVSDPAGAVGLPRSFDLAAALDRWVHADVGVREGDLRYGPKRGPQYPPEVAEHVQRARAQIDLAGYLVGWTAAVREIWKAVRPALE
jgi:hypothetical protein